MCIFVCYQLKISDDVYFFGLFNSDILWACLYNYICTQEVHLGESISLKALPYGEPDPNLEFKWLKNGSLKAEENELKMEKVSSNDCAGYYNCKILRNGKDFFSVHHCLKLAGKCVFYFLELC